MTSDRDPCRRAPSPAATSQGSADSASSGAGTGAATASDGGAFRLVIDQLREGIATLAVEDFTVQYANHAMLRMLGRSESEVVGVPLTAFLDADDGAGIVELAQASAAGRLEVDLVAADGSRTPAALSLTRIETATGSLLGVSAFNLTGQHEQMRQQRERFELMGRRKDEFIAMLGHELRNPLAPLRHAAELLESAGQGDAGISLPDITLLMRRQVDHMARLVADLLDIGRASSGRIMVRREPTRIAEVIDAALESTMRLAQRRSHMLVHDRGTTRGLVLDADPVRLTQVITNLLSNAIKYTPECGRIELRCVLDGDSLRLQVTDDGRGIAAADLEQIFEPFYQAGATLDRGAGGLGVGLAMVRRIVELHGGTVAAASPGIGAGATFEVRLPGARRERTTGSVAVAAPEAGLGAPGLRILVIDDNEDAARMLALLLEGRGCAADAVFLGNDGLKMLAQHTYDLAFVDIGLPDLDGYGFARQIAGTSACPQHLIALTGYGQSEDRRRALEAGFHEHLVKPLTPQRLDEILGEARSSAIRAASPTD